MRSPILLRVGFLIAMAVVVLSACSGQVNPTDKSLHGTVWVADEEGNSITVINAATNKVITTLRECFEILL